MSTPEINELYRMGEVAYDVALNFGNVSDDAKTKAQRFVNRAAVRIAGIGPKRWSWLFVKDSFNTITDQEEYSLAQDADLLQMLWMTGSNRRKLVRIPTKKAREIESDPESTTGTPSMWDERGVDSSGSKVISLFPVPSGTYEIFYRYQKILTPIYDEDISLREFWGMPPNVIEALIEMATAMMWKGLNDDRYESGMAEAMAMLEQAYSRDQEKNDTVYRARYDGDYSRENDDPQLPPQFSRF